MQTGLPFHTFLEPCFLKAHHFKMGSDYLSKRRECMLQCRLFFLKEF